MFTLSEMSRQVARLVFPDMIYTGAVTSRTTASITDTSLTLPDATFDKGTIWVISGTTFLHLVLICRGHRGSTLSFDDQDPDLLPVATRYMVASAAYPYHRIKAAIQQALDDTYIDGTDESAALYGDGETLSFALPAGVYDVKSIHHKDPNSDYKYKSNHWKEKQGYVEYEPGYPPPTGYHQIVTYRARHDDLVDYDDEIDADINLKWLRYQAARYLLDWAMGAYKAQSEYRIEERMNLVLETLKGLSPRNAGPDIIIRTAEA